MLNVVLFLAAFVQSTLSQTFTSCNPLTASCPADPALAGTTNVDFTKGASDDFTVVGSPSYQSDGMHLTVAQRGDAPTLTSKWYMMFGHIDIKMKAAPGQGIVSSVVLQSDDLDEIDLEWVGSDSIQVQSNYFGKGKTLTYDRGAYHPVSDAHNWHTYSIDFTAEQIVWQVDGVTVRAMTPASAESNQYPQTPMQLKIGIWSGGDPSNSQGTITWAGGLTNYGGGPYTMVIASVRAVDYSTGTSYSYGDNSGTWQSIKSNGGSVNGGAGNAGSAAGASAPAITEVSSGSPTPFDGTHRGSSSFATPSEWPWVASSTDGASGATQTDQYPGLPSGWTVSTGGKVVPPSAACASELPARPALEITVHFLSSTHQPTSSASSLQSASSSASPVSTSVAEPQPKTLTTANTPVTTTLATSTTLVPATANSGSITTVVYNQEGFATTIVVPSGWTKQYDSQGFLILPTQTGKGSINAVATVANNPATATMSSASTGTPSTSSSAANMAMLGSTTSSTSTSSTTTVTSASAASSLATSLVTTITTTSTPSTTSNAAGTGTSTSTSSTNVAPTTKAKPGLSAILGLFVLYLLLFTI